MPRLACGPGSTGLHHDSYVVRALVSLAATLAELAVNRTVTTWRMVERMPLGASAWL